MDICFKGIHLIMENSQPKPSPTKANKSFIFVVPFVTQVGTLALSSFAWIPMAFAGVEVATNNCKGLTIKLYYLVT